MIIITKTEVNNCFYYKHIYDFLENKFKIHSKNIKIQGKKSKSGRHYALGDYPVVNPRDV